MKNALVKVEQEAAGELAVLKQRIAQYDDGFRRAYSQQMGYAFLAGLAVKRAKEILPHGKFIPWIEEEAKLTHRSAHRYAQFVDALVKAYPAVGKCATAVAYLPEGGSVADLSSKDQETIITAVHDVADGKTLTEFYRDLGVIRQPKKQQHHPKKITPEEKADSDRMLAEQRGGALVGDIRQLLHEWTEYQAKAGEQLPTIALLPAKLRGEIAAVIIDLGKVLKAIKKKAGKAPEPLFACPHCKRDGFMERGLRSHHCDALPKEKGRRPRLDEETVNAIVGGGK